MPSRASIGELTRCLHQFRHKKSVQEALALYEYMRKGGFEYHWLAGNNTILMLAELGFIHKARHVFGKIRVRDEQAWYALIYGCIQAKKPKLALSLYEEMGDDDSLHVNGPLYVAILKACAMLKDIERGIQVHLQIDETGLLNHDIYVGGALVDMYAKCGSITKAQKVFDSLPFHDVVMWNSLIHGYAKYGHEDEALKCFESMQLDGINPTVVTFVCVLKACGQIGNVNKGLEIHDELERRKLLEGNLFLGNSLIDMYAKWGQLAKAQEVFEELPIRDVITWNVLITGYVEYGHGKRALECYQQMKQAHIVPDVVTYICTLKACASIRDINKGSLLHEEITERGLLDRDPALGNALVDMYAKCGLLMKAHNVFNLLRLRNVVSWNTLISGYVADGQGEEALTCFKEMLSQGIDPDSASYISSLKACSLTRALHVGGEIHAEVERKGLLDKDVLMNSTLVDMYAKCGVVSKAQEVFDKLPIRSIISWTALIWGYTENGDAEAALNCFEKMKSDGFSPDAITFVCSLKACGSSKALKKGQEIHGEIERTGLLEKDPYVGSVLVDMYAKCGLLDKAWCVFDTIPIRDAITWNALINRYSDLGYGEESLKCYEMMRFEGVSPTVVTYVCTLKACCNMGAIDKGNEIHSEIEKYRFLVTDLFVANTLIDMYAKFGIFTKAKDVFDKLPVRDIVSWNALLSGYVEHGLVEEALECFGQMQADGIDPNAITLTCALKACGSIGAIDKASEIHMEIERSGLLERDVSVGSTLVDTYVQCGLISKARSVFDKLPVRDVVSWTALIAGYTERGLGEEAIQCFERMQFGGFPIDGFILVCSLKACGSIGATKKGQEIHAEIERRGFLETDLVVGNSLVNMYIKCGSLFRAQHVFDQLAVRDMISWNTLLGGYTHLGDSSNVFSIFDRMVGEGIRPGPVTFLIVLNACSRKGLYMKGQSYLEAMSRDYGLAPSLEHHTCMIDLLSRKGKLNEALSIINDTPFSPDLVTWRTVLVACMNSGNVELGKQAFKRAIVLNEKHAIPYVMMSKICAETGKKSYENSSSNE